MHGAAGGVGTATIQVARGYGARTIAVVSTEAKGEVARAAGADEVVLLDGFKEAVSELTGGRGVDVVAGRRRRRDFTDSLRSLATQGRLLVVGFASGQGIPEVRVNRLLLNNVDVRGVGWGAYAMTRPGFMQGQWQALLPMIESGVVKPPIGATYADGGVGAGAARHGPAPDARQVRRPGPVNPAHRAARPPGPLRLGPDRCRGASTDAPTWPSSSTSSPSPPPCVAAERGIAVLPLPVGRRAGVRRRARRGLAVGRLEARARGREHVRRLCWPSASSGRVPSPNGSAISFGLAATGAQVVAACLRNRDRRRPAPARARPARSRWSPPANAGPTARSAPAPRTCGARARSWPSCRDADLSPEARLAADAFRAVASALADRAARLRRRPRADAEGFGEDVARRRRAGRRATSCRCWGRVVQPQSAVSGWIATSPASTPPSVSNALATCGRGHVRVEVLLAAPGLDGHEDARRGRRLEGLVGQAAVLARGRRDQLGESGPDRVAGAGLVGMVATTRSSLMGRT